MCGDSVARMGHVAIVLLARCYVDPWSGVVPSLRPVAAGVWLRGRMTLVGSELRGRLVLRLRIPLRLLDVVFDRGQGVHRALVAVYVAVVAL